MGVILEGKPVAEKLEKEIKEKIQFYKSQGVIPTLCIVKVGKNAEAEAYAKSIEKFFSKIGINIERKNFNEEISLVDFKKIMKELEEDSAIHGVLILRPLPEELERGKAFQFLPTKKDVEGVTYENLGRLLVGEDSFHPCTPQAVLELLDFYQIPVEGKNVVVVGRSISVGKPLSLLLLNRNATITVCHSKTKNLVEFTKKAEILIVAIGKPYFVGKDMVGEGQVIIDVGTNVVDGKLVGDVNFEEVKDKVEYITPVPGGIGVITTRVLAMNLLKAVKKVEA
ncbi:MULTISPECIES: bifunctional 5,10-methylenetetrahydrofolate dehydrogenase/5,10-methenyltetrahydrofolate cyclohydrolase [Dictyoglomus]|jgi:methylenetetrahydrofolate dehydrogenase (NADP+)/methenyltetrahydrofolate cyclohydrolase|uniref:Bifunctional protein FolD n=1 Tax=Dictyoglomus turgidum (strain DSM 6724 / Z-1310) TaxID=515635 RepID=FOLD_DICTD|nr:MULTISPECIES: bifunctional 5,10-methylenetetrahydrofolate dehydrogenase/5,10-methenyltetrahydrofolate cyclohydrolase [Dictyoglomus]B8E335.1 RecName: Full=Bifunctional protein FolD; Includes: RecName: Full=Methylenetetrahydrofolate dehydrogenase; Includes: RecName: Full=Methenyltetrahydrofolate cyclohydrolase [Dictyoglomus turgidum DSM 6724]ACK42909.1 Methenyltetrahydrofolate cyclohydrolase [Dictyoglomus turgidum DSM 6724]HBU30971.1 bifunctional 5,10-methylenetetrahydrofolate dehydrogenase/5,1